MSETKETKSGAHEVNRTFFCIFCDQVKPIHQYLGASEGHEICRDCAERRKVHGPTSVFCSDCGAVIAIEWTAAWGFHGKVYCLRCAAKKAEGRDAEILGLKSKLLEMHGALDAALDAWRREASEGDGIMEEDVPVYDAAKAVLEKMAPSALDAEDAVLEVYELEERLEDAQRDLETERAKVRDLQRNALPSNCSTCNGKGSEPPHCPESGPCPTCGGWDDRKRTARDIQSRVHAVQELLAIHGCDCECEDAGEHGPECERCFACRVEMALNPKAGTR